MTDEKTVSLDEMKSRTFILRQQLEQEVKLKMEAETEQHNRVSNPFFPLTRNWFHHRKNWFREYEAIEEKYRNIYENHPASKELEQLQSMCSHIFCDWKDSRPGSQDRICSICGLDQWRIIPFQGP